jgi:hypothetical protein
VQSLIKTAEGREGLLLALERAIKEESALRLQLELLLRPPTSQPLRKMRELCN